MTTATTATRARPLGPVALLGASGMLGRAWGERLNERNIPFRPVTRPTLDLADPNTVEAAVQPGDAVVINCAAYTDVDGAESHEDDAFAANAVAVERLASQCRRIGALLVHFSTDYVFDGRGNRPWRTRDPRRPINAYGRSKAAGEEAIERSACHALIVRTSWLYAPWGKNFVRTIARLAGERESLSVVNDQRGRPTSARHLAAATLALVERGDHGIFHVTDGGECTWFDFAARIVQNLGLPCRVEPCTTDAFPRPARRPANSVLDLTETEKRLGPMPSWQDNLLEVVGMLER